MVPLRVAVRELGLCKNTLRKYADEGKIKAIRTPAGQRRFDIESFFGKAREKSVVCYCRVSLPKQKDDLVRQVAFMQQQFPEAQIRLSGFGSKKGSVYMIPQIAPFLDADSLTFDLGSYLHSGGWLTEHKKTEELEHIFAEFLGKKHCIIVPSGTIALSLSVLALTTARSPSVHKDQVIVPDLTMIATANAVLLHDAKLSPKLVDIDSNNGCLDLNRVDNTSYSRARGLIYVSLNGRSGDLEEVRKFCDRADMFFIEDACQSFGSKTADGKYLGTMGDVGCFSMSPHKIITTGQGGFVVTDIDDIAKEIRYLKDFGRKTKGVDEHVSLGFNFKFTDLQAVVGINQMKNIFWRLDRKKEIYDRYYENLSRITDINMYTRELNTVPWFVDVYSGTCIQKIKERLMKEEIGYRVVYPPLHTQYPYCLYGGGYNCFPVSTDLSKAGIWLPSSLNITNKEIDYICDCIKWAVAS